MYERFIVAVLVISVALLALLYFGYKTPVRERNESKDDYMERVKDHECTYYGSRNLLIIVLIFAGGAYVHCIVKKQGTIKMGYTGGAIEDMEVDEPDLYKNEEVEEKNVVSDISDEE